MQDNKENYQKFRVICTLTLKWLTAYQEAQQITNLTLCHQHQGSLSGLFSDKFPSLNNLATYPVLLLTHRVIRHSKSTMCVLNSKLCHKSYNYTIINFIHKTPLEQIPETQFYLMKLPSQDSLYVPNLYTSDKSLVEDPTIRTQL